MAGVVEAVGKNVQNWQVGDRVTVPFVGGCGHCPQCASGNHQVCDDQFQPGFTHWGCFAEYVAIQRADINLVRLPEAMTFETASSLGCRFITSFRAVVDQGAGSARANGCGTHVAVRRSFSHHDSQCPGRECDCDRYWCKPVGNGKGSGCSSRWLMLHEQIMLSRSSGKLPEVASMFPSTRLAVSKPV